MFFENTITKALHKTFAGEELTIGQKLLLAGTRDYMDDPEWDDYMKESIRYSDVNVVCGAYDCVGFIDREIGYEFMEEQQRLIDEEHEREFNLSQAEYLWEYEWSDELLIENEQIHNTNWTPLEHYADPLPKWKVDLDTITKLLEVA